MPTKATTMFSLARVKAYLGATQADKDQMITDVADGVSERIETLTGRKIVTRSVTQLCDANGKDKVALRDYPVTGITSVKRRTDLGASWELIDPANYEMDGRLGIVYLKSASGSFPSGPLTTEVVFTAGFGAQDAATLPLFQEGLDWVKFAFTRSGNNLLLVSSTSEGGRTAVVVPEPPKDIMNAILAYRKVRL